MYKQGPIQKLPHVVPVILAGGDGCRLWPLSRPDRPKPFIKLGEDLSPFQKTILRCEELDLFRSPIVVVGAQHRPLIEKQLEELNITPAAIVAEPVARDTAAAISLAAQLFEEDTDNDTIMAVLPSDLKMAPFDDFRAMMMTGAEQAGRTGLLVTFGIKPTRAATEYGYIRRGAKLSSADGYLVDAFVEKPDAQIAEDYLKSGKFLWNSGMFMFPVGTLISELQRHCAGLFESCREAIKTSASDGYALVPNEAVLSPLPKISIDYALMEKTAYAAVVRCTMDWDDLGDWDSIAAYAHTDKMGNSVSGHALIEGCSNNYVHSSDVFTTVVGLDDCIVVSTKDAVLVTARNKAKELKTLVKKMQDRNIPEGSRHPGEVRPWGQFAPLHAGESHQVKVIDVKPGGRLSLQKHSCRAEHWIVVAGVATVTVGDECKILGVGDHVHIPLGEIHRLENFGTEPVKLIEVQTGTYFGEDDIIRLEDVYGRLEPVQPTVSVTQEKTDGILVTDTVVS